MLADGKDEHRFNLLLTVQLARRKRRLGRRRRMQLVRKRRSRDRRRDWPGWRYGNLLFLGP